MRKSNAVLRRITELRPSEHPLSFFAILSLIAIPCFVTEDKQSLLSLFGYIMLALCLSAVLFYIIIAQERYLKGRYALPILVTGMLIPSAVFLSCTYFGYAALGAIAMLMLLCLCVMSLELIGGSMNTERFIFYILLFGFLIRLLYIVYTPYSLRQHDVSLLGKEHGHIGYIEYLINNNFSLPDFDPTTVDQFYHPPLHHFIAAVFVKINMFFGASLEQATENIQFLTLFYSSVMNLVFWRILKVFKLKTPAAVISVMIFVFLPGMVILSGSINNDMLCMMLVSLAFYFTLRWYMDMSILKIIPAALCIGLSMMAKSSGALAAPAMAFIFLAAFIKSRGKRFKLIGQFAVFGIIALPLGLWWSLYNLIRWGMPLGYVQKLSADSWQYIGNYSLWERFFDFGSYQFASPFLSLRDVSYLEHNAFIALFKTAVFDESNFAAQGKTIVTIDGILLWVFIFLALFALIALFKMLFGKKAKENRIQRIALIILFATFMGSYLSFCIQYPHVCTQNFRYVVPAFMAGCGAIGIVLNDIIKRKNTAKHIRA